MACDIFLIIFDAIKSEQKRRLWDAFIFFGKLALSIVMFQNHFL
jgi:hypothetical protein